jgi:alpha-tubulin suppressor-like RCC1 family protein
MNVNQIEIALSQKIGASSTDFDLLAASKALQLLKTNGVFVVSSYGGLPAAASNEGKIYFIEDIETVVWSNGTDWLKLLDKNTIQFQLWSWGYSNNGQLGDGTLTNKCSPVREFCSATDWSQVSGGSRHSAGVKTSGELWSWGCNTCGPLGSGTVTTVCSPIREFCSATDWCHVNAGRNKTIAIKTSGELWTWGCNLCGDIGDGTTTPRCSPVREFCSATDWCFVGSSAYAFSVVAIKTSGELWAWGSNNSGRLGDGTTTDKCSPVREICSATNWCQASIGDFGAAIKTSGELWAWGSGSSGQLGDGTAVAKCSPVREFCSGTNWCEVSMGSTNTAAIKTSGELWAWGSNICGRLGDGTTTNRCSPVREICSAADWCQVSAGGAGQTAAIKTTGQLWLWGRNNNGTIGDGTTTSRCSPVREITSATNWCLICTGGGQALAIKVT